MPAKFTITADTIEELQQAARQLAALTPPTEQEQMQPTSQTDWNDFVNSRSPNQKKILVSLINHGGQINLRQLQTEIDLSGAPLAGTLASLQRASKKRYNATIILTGPWSQQQDGTWDRTYTINPAIYRSNH
ncbi:MAG: hypothetical protein HYX94_10115 [Chloroflexi bacterium]|nr:hypothetical protein [Chloroflexota bacterium]